MAAKKATKKKKNPRYLGMTKRRNPPGLAKRRNPLYAYQISVLQPGEGVRPLGGFPAHSRTDALKMAERELRKKGQWSARTKLLTAAVPLSSTAARHKNVAGFMDASGAFHPLRESGDYDRDRAGETGGKARRTRSKKTKGRLKKAASTARFNAQKRATSSVKAAASRRLARTTSTGKRLSKKRNPTLPTIKLPMPTSFKTLADAKKQRAAVARVEAQVNRAGEALLKAFRAVDAEITKAWKSGQPSPALRAKYKTAEARSSRAQSLKGRLNIYLESLDRHIANLRLQTKTRNPRRNSGAAESNRCDFAGTFSGYKELYFPEGTPKEGLSTLGPLVLIRTESGDIKPAGGTAVLCQDEAGKLYIGAKQNAPLIDGGARSFGKVRRVEYVCSKPHLGYPGRITWFHDFENPLPTLKSDGRGGLHFHGGGYTIRREGITG